jgi:hypothetical protein
MYAAVFEAVAITAVQDLFEIAAGADKPIQIHGLRLSQTTDLGDAQEEVLRIRIRSGQTVTGSGGTTATGVPVDVDNVATGATVKANNTTQAGTGTIVVNDVLGWNIRVPLDHWWPPEARPFIKGSRRSTIELVAAPVDSVTVSGTLYYSEG